MPSKSLGQIAYEAFHAVASQYRQLPWDQHTTDAQALWDAAPSAVIAEHDRRKAEADTARVTLEFSRM